MSRLGVASSNAGNTGGGSGGSSTTPPTTAGVLSLSTSSLSFGSVPVGSDSSGTVRLLNSGNAALTISQISGDGNFSFNPTGVCATISPGAYCDVAVSFTPLSLGTNNGHLYVNTSVGNSTVALTGVGTGQGVLEASTGSNTITFGSVNIGATSATQTVQLLNSGNIPLTVQSLTTSGDFTYSAPNCTTLNAGTTCNVAMAMTPTAVGTRTGTLSITSTGGNLSIPLNGVGVGHAVISSSVANGTSMSFGANLIGTTSATQTVTITNTGNIPMNISDLSVTGDYAKTTSGCTTVAVGGTCTVNITMTPTASGQRNGVFTVTSDGGNLSINLTGTGQTSISSSLSGIVTSVVAPTGDFGTVGTNTPTYKTYYVLASGDVGTLNSNFEVAGTGFTIDSVGKVNTSNTKVSCGASVSTTLATGCVADALGGTSPNTYVTVKFLPTDVQNYTGTLTVTNNGGTPTVVNLTGTGSLVDPLFNKVVFLDHFDNTYNDVRGSTVAAIGTTPPSLSSASYKYGTGSMLFNGTNGSYFAVANDGRFNFTGDFTVEMWLNPTAAGLINGMIAGTYYWDGSQHGGWGLFYGGNNRLFVNIGGTAIIGASASTAITLNTWSHVAIVRSGSAWTLYLNGVSVGTGTYSGTIAAANAGPAHLFIGNNGGSPNWNYRGYMDEFRITTAARYTGTFTPPTTAFANN